MLDQIINTILSYKMFNSDTIFIYEIFFCKSFRASTIFPSFDNYMISSSLFMTNTAPHDHAECYLIIEPKILSPINLKNASVNITERNHWEKMPATSIHWCWIHTKNFLAYMVMMNKELQGFSMKKLHTSPNSSYKLKGLYVRSVEL